MQGKSSSGRGRFGVAALFVVALALSSPVAFADGNGDVPTPKPAGGSALYSEAYGAVVVVFKATSLLMDLVY
jgi:hypothetical protein